MTGSALAGKTVLVTRPQNRSGKIVELLEQRGAVPLLLPVSDIAAPLDVQPLDAALRRLYEFDWIIFTSVNGVEAVHNRMASLGLARELLDTVKIAVVGPSTGEAVESRWRTPDVMPTEYVSDAIAAAIPNLKGSRFLLPRGDLARAELSVALASAGAVVLDVTAYRLVRRSGSLELDTDKRPDAISLMSGESARSTIGQLRDAGLSEWLENCPLACIGPVTAEAVLSEGYRPAIVAKSHTLLGLLEALEEVFAREPALA